MKTVIQIALFIVALFVAYKIYQSVQRPIEFEKLKEARYDVTIERLKDIRTAELAYKEVYGQFTADWDTLIDFVKYDSIGIVRKIGMLTDSMIDAGINEQRALQLGLIIRDTIKESILVSEFGPGFDADQLKYVPVSDTLAEFHLGATVYEAGSGLKVPIFEAKVHNNTVLKDLDKQLVINLNDERRIQDKYPGLKVGSLIEANNNAGNWE